MTRSINAADLQDIFNKKKSPSKKKRFSQAQVLHPIILQKPKAIEKPSAMFNLNPLEIL